MPDYLTHALFAQRLLDQEAFSLKACCQRHANLFRLGSQGPDLFYYLAYLAPGRGYGRIADALHKRDMTDVLEYLHTLDFTNTDFPFASAYLGGYAAHLCLDEIVHPMICARAVTLAAALGCSESCAHVKYENRIESRHFSEVTGRHPSEYLLRGDLPATERETTIVAAVNAGMVQTFLGKTIDQQALCRAIGRLPLLLGFLFDKNKKAQRLTDALTRGRDHTLKWRFKRDYEPDASLLPEAEFEKFWQLYEDAIRRYIQVVN